MNIFHGPWPWVILVVVLLLFGAPKLPALARSLGQSMRIFRGEMKTMKDDEAPAAGTDASAASSAAPSSAPAASDDAKPGA